LAAVAFFSQQDSAKEALPEATMAEEVPQGLLLSSDFLGLEACWIAFLVVQQLTEASSMTERQIH
jgi:hypothetical protein